MNKMTCLLQLARKTRSSAIVQLYVNQHVQILLLFVRLIAENLPVSARQDMSGIQLDNVYHKINVNHQLQLAHQTRSSSIVQLNVNQRVQILLLSVSLNVENLPVSAKEDLSGIQLDSVYHKVNVHNLQLAQEMNSGIHVRVHVNRHVSSLGLWLVVLCVTPPLVSAKQGLSGMLLGIAYHHFNVEDHFAQEMSSSLNVELSVNQHVQILILRLVLQCANLMSVSA